MASQIVWSPSGAAQMIKVIGAQQRLVSTAEGEFSVSPRFHPKRENRARRGPRRWGLRRYWPRAHPSGSRLHRFIPLCGSGLTYVAPNGARDQLAVDFLPNF